MNSYFMEAYVFPEVLPKCLIKYYHSAGSFGADMNLEAVLALTSGERITYNYATFQ